MDEVGAMLIDFSKRLMSSLKLNDAEASRLLDRLFADCLVFCKFVSSNFLSGAEPLRAIADNKIAIERLAEDFSRKVGSWEGGVIM